MTQAHDMLAATIAALGAIAFGIAAGVVAIGVLMLARGDRPGRAAAGSATAGTVPTGFRHCPEEQRTRAAVVHGDGSATCSNCHTHIPAGDS